MNNAHQKIITKVLDAFHENDSRAAWELVVEHIGGRKDMGIPDECLSSGVVPRRWGWKLPSLAQAFALTYDGDDMMNGTGPDGYRLLELITRPSDFDNMANFTLTELRASFYALQRQCRWQETDPEPRQVKRLLTEIRKRLRDREVKDKGEENS